MRLVLLRVVHYLYSSISCCVLFSVAMFNCTSYYLIISFKWLSRMTLTGLYICRRLKSLLGHFKITDFINSLPILARTEPDWHSVNWIKKVLICFYEMLLINVILSISIRNTCFYLQRCWIYKIKRQSSLSRLT